MGLNERSNSQNNFLVIKHHSICLESKTPIEGFEPVEVTNPKTSEQIIKYIKKFASLTGTIVRLEWHDTKDQYPTRFMSLKVHVKDGPDHFILELPLQSRAYDTFTKVMENINYEQPVEIAAWHNRREDNTAFAIKQNDQFVQWKYTRDNMHGCPPAEQDSFGKWDFSKQKSFLHGVLINQVIPHVDSLNQMEEPMPEYSGEEAPFIPTEPPPDLAQAEADIPW
jgi:hypothetical protein